MHALDKLTEYVGGVRRLIHRPPMIVPIRELLSSNAQATTDAWFKGMIDDYSRSLPPERRVLFEQYHLVEVARKVVGVGSVGTHCWIALFSGVDNDDPLFLQVKEAEASVLERFVGASKIPHHGERVVSGQRLMQASSDILLGWLRTIGIDGKQRDFYLRQLRDWKGSFAVENARPAGLSV